jgi:hypothetical protein
MHSRGEFRLPDILARATGKKLGRKSRVGGEGQLVTSV